ncbi:hypothetical protein C8Q77DRAFT_1104112 [Trametes polyzona]|nr:hypothetical protein C8Q77DRAFT_1104112 [Trametes polyzona]
MITSLSQDPAVLVKIGEFIGLRRRADLLPLLLVNKLVNAVLTPVLYTDIDLLECASALKCIRTLAAPPSLRAFRRDLPALVQAFVLRVPAEDLPWSPDSHAFGAPLLTCLLRMVNLRHFTCLLPLPFAPSMLALLVSGSRPLLQTIELVIPKAREPRPAMRIRLDPDDPAKLPDLRTFKLDVWQPLEPTLARTVHNLLRSRANTLKSLALTSSLAEEGVDIVNQLLPSNATFTSLEELHIEASALSHPSLRQTASIKTLSIPGSPTDDEDLQDHAFIHDSFPAIESLACPNSILPAFFPEDVQRRRPIHTLRLNGASYGMRSFDYTGDESDWFELQEFLPLLRHSAVPVRHLSFAVMDLPIEDLPDIVPHLMTLETLVVAFTDDIEDAEEYLVQLGRVLIAHLPHLHTFLLSDAPVKAQNEDRGFRHAQNIPLQRKALAEYSKHSSNLQRVAFTSDFLWEKRGSDWSLIPATSIA